MRIRNLSANLRSKVRVVLSYYRNWAKENTAAYLPKVAMTLNNLGAVYNNTQRLSEAERAYDEALKIRRKLAEENEPVTKLLSVERSSISASR